MTDVRLLVDLGGTNTRCALQRPGSAPERVRATRNDGFPDFTSVLLDYLAHAPVDLRPTSAAIAVAAPVAGDRVEMTNLGWSFSAEALRAALGVNVLRVVNDFTAVAMSLPFLDVDMLVQSGGGGPEGGRAMAVLGPGTGLGVSGLLPVPGGWAAVSGEGGHVTLAATDDREATVISLIRQQQGHVSAERLVSGFGLGNLYMALKSLSGEPGERLQPEEVSARADAGDSVAREALGHFFSFLGITAGNLALTLGALGGVYIAGGIVPRLREAFLASRFRDRFESKGRYADYMRRIPTYLVMEPVPAFRGLAAILDGRMADPEI
jgi:glucokinase